MIEKLFARRLASPTTRRIALPDLSAIHQKDKAFRHPLARTSAYWFIGSLIRSIANSLTQPLAHPLAHLLVHPFAHLLTPCSSTSAHSIFRSLDSSSACPLMLSLVRSFVHPSFAHSLARLLICLPSHLLAQSLAPLENAIKITKTSK